MDLFTALSDQQQECCSGGLWILASAAPTITEASRYPLPKGIARKGLDRAIQWVERRYKVDIQDGALGAIIWTPLTGSWYVG
jgi:hypothetical protein